MLIPEDLDKIEVASPCPARWDDMVGDERARHCELCQLNVYNLSAMSREEAAELISEREGRLCVRFFRRDDGTVLTADCPRGVRAAARRAAALAAAAIAIVITATLTCIPLVRRALAGSSLDGLRNVEPIKTSVDMVTPPPPPPGRYDLGVMLVRPSNSE